MFQVVKESQTIMEQKQDKDHMLLHLGQVRIEQFLKTGTSSG